MLGFLFEDRGRSKLDGVINTDGIAILDGNICIYIHTHTMEYYYSVIK